MIDDDPLQLIAQNKCKGKKDKIESFSKRLIRKEYDMIWYDMIDQSTIWYDLKEEEKVEEEEEKVEEEKEKKEGEKSSIEEMAELQYKKK